MKNYPDSDYALNKFSAGIVYRFADQIVEVTLTDYLAENPGKTEADFLSLKALSDADYLERVTVENKQTYMNIPLDGACLLDCCAATSIERELDRYEKAFEDDSDFQLRLALAGRVLVGLTESQRRHFIKYAIKGMTTRKIGIEEGITHQAASKSILAAKKKIKKLLGKAQKSGCQNAPKIALGEKGSQDLSPAP
jgi:HEPN domain-containing protein